MKQTAFISLIALFLLSCTQTGNSSEKPIILRQMPHDRQAFTQGLLLHDNILYESTGRFGKSSLRSLSVQNGVILSLKRLPGKYFGEGLAILNNNLYQLTWKSGIARVYTLPQMDLTESLSYSGEGWGLTAAGNNLVMSKGSDALYVMTKEFKLIKKITVRFENSTIKRLNELEYANGNIYANQWLTNYIFEIDYPSGKVTKIIDCKNITSSLSGLKRGEVLNGIAYNPSRDSFYITGKNWPSIFEVKFP